MNIFKTSVLTGIATIARLLSGFIVMKLVAVLSGPEGVAQLGQFMSLTALLVVFAGGGVGPGVIKYLAEFKDDDAKAANLLRSAFSFTVIASLCMCLLVLLSSNYIAAWLLGSSEFQWLIVVLAVAQIFVALHNLVIATVNGMMDVKRLAFIHVCGALAGTLLPVLLGYFYKLNGVLLAFVLGQAALLVISFSAYKRSSYFKWSNIGWRVEKMDFALLARFSLMTLTSALLAPIVQIAVRNYLAGVFSWEVVGYWQAVSKVSEAYLLFITMAISVYYLPKLSALQGKRELVREIKGAYMYLMPLVAALGMLIYLFRDLITVVLFSREFLSASYLYAPQLIGDVIKIASFIFSYMMLAKAMTKTFLLSELVFSGMYFGWVVILTEYFGLIGAMYAFAVNYFLYWVFTGLVTFRYVRRI